ncbi:Uncharacterized protein PBTT_07587 [Plasmodiophora brassicae]
MAFVKMTKAADRPATGPGFIEEGAAGLGVLANASLFVATSAACKPLAHVPGKRSPMNEPVPGEASSAASQGRSCDHSASASDTEEGETSSSSARAPLTIPASMGVGIAAMEQAMTTSLAQAQQEGDAAPTSRSLLSCNLCPFTGDSHGKVVEHMIMEHRMTVMRAMHELDMAGMRHRHMSLYGPSQPSPDPFTILPPMAIEAVEKIAAMQVDSEVARQLSPVIDKILADGPAVWIMAYQVDAKRQAEVVLGLEQKRQRREAQSPLDYPLCPKTSRIVPARIGPGFDQQQTGTHAEGVIVPIALSLKKQYDAIRSAAPVPAHPVV